MSDEKMGRELVVENLRAGLRSYGYVVMSEPVAGGEDAWIAQLREALQKVDECAESLRKDRGHRTRYLGKSKALIRALHNWLPEPAWGVEIDPRLVAERKAAQTSAFQ